MAFRGLPHGAFLFEEVTLDDHSARESCKNSTVDFPAGSIQFPGETVNVDRLSRSGTDHDSIIPLVSSHIRSTGSRPNFRFLCRSADDKTAGGPAQDAGVLRERQRLYPIRHTIVEGQKRDATLPDGVLPAIELVLAAPRLHHCRAAAQRAVDFHQAQQNNVVYDRADGEIRHKGR